MDTLPSPATTASDVVDIVDEYDLLCKNSLIESYLPCDKSNLLKEYAVVRSSDGTSTTTPTTSSSSSNATPTAAHCLDQTTSINHEILKMCVQTHTIYFTCITYHASVDAVERHVCDMFPVFIGSTVDRDLCRFHHVHVGGKSNEYVYDEATARDLRGMIYIDSSLSYFPHLLTNRKEFGHMVKRSNGVYCLYAYDKENRGHKFSIDSNFKFVYRNENGVDFSRLTGDPKFQVSTHHLDTGRIQTVLERMYTHSINIDSLANKLILSPINILENVITMAQRRPSHAREIIVRGELEKFASSTIVYRDESVSSSGYNAWSKNSGVTTFNYRKIQPNQILRPNTVGRERVVVRPIPKNVNQSSIPKDTEHFMCLLDKSVGITSPNRWMLLLPNVQITKNDSIERCSVDELLVKLLAIGHIRKRTQAAAETDVLVGVCGGLTTNYVLCVDFEVLFRFAKSLNNFFEILLYNRVLMINLTKGVPFVPLADYKVSPLELNASMSSPDFHLPKLPLDPTMFGYNCSEGNIKYFSYGIPNKMIVATNHYKNRFGSMNAFRYFPYTSESSCIYINDGTDERHWSHDRATMNMRVVFTAHPQITADSYVMSTNVRMGVTIASKSHISLDVQPNMNFVQPEGSSQTISERDRNGIVVKKYTCILRVYKLGAEMCFKIFPQMKVFVTSAQTSNGFVYNFFKYYDERHHLENEVTVDTSIAIKNKRVFIDILSSVHVAGYDGLKLSDQCSQKGLATKQSTDHLDVQADVYASIYSLIGRSSLIEMKSVAASMEPRDNADAAGDAVLCGDYQFFILKNLTSNMKSFSPIKIDMYSAKILSTNGINSGLYALQQNSLRHSERGAFLPDESEDALSIIGNCKVGVEFTDENDNVRSVIPFTRRRHIIEAIDFADIKSKKKCL